MDLVKRLQFLGVNVSEADINQPEPDRLTVILRAFLVKAFKVREEMFNMFPLKACDEVNALNIYPDLFARSTAVITVTRAMTGILKDFLKDMHDDVFSLSTVIKPVPKTTRRILTLLADIYEFKEFVAPIEEEIRQQCNELQKELDDLDHEWESLQSHKDRLESGIRQSERRVNAQRELKCQLEKTAKELDDDVGKAENETLATCSALTRSLEQKDQLAIEAENLRMEMATIEVDMEEDPEVLHAQLSRLQEEIEEKKKAVASEEQICRDAAHRIQLAEQICVILEAQMAEYNELVVKGDKLTEARDITEDAVAALEKKKRDLEQRRKQLAALKAEAARDEATHREDEAARAERMEEVAEENRAIQARIQELKEDKHRQAELKADERALRAKLAEMNRLKAVTIRALNEEANRKVEKYKMCDMAVEKKKELAELIRRKIEGKMAKVKEELERDITFNTTNTTSNFSFSNIL